MSVLWVFGIGGVCREKRSQWNERVEEIRKIASVPFLLHMSHSDA